MAREVEARLRLSAVDRTAKAFHAVQRRLDDVDRKTKAMNRSFVAFDKVGPAIGRAEAALVSYAKVMAALAAGAGIAGAVRQTAAFETQLVAIQKKAGLTTAQMEELGKEARALATSGDLAMPLEEILGAYERGAAAGLPRDDLKEFARLSAMAADAFEMSASDVGDAAAKMSLGLGIPMAEMERYFDLINGLADAGTSDERDIVDFITRIGQPLKQFGLVNEDIAATGATLLNLGMNSETAARMMGTLTNKLLTPTATKKSASAFARLYGDADNFTDLLKKDTRGALVDFLRRVEKLDKFARAEILTDIIGQGFSDEIARMAGGMDEFIRNLDYAGGRDWFGSLSQSYQLKLATMESQWQLFKNQVSELAIDIGLRGLPAMKEGLDWLKETVAEIDQQIEDLPHLLDPQSLEGAKTAFGELKAGVEQLLNIDTSGSTIKTFFKDLADVVNSVGAGLTTVRESVEWLHSLPGTVRSALGLPEATEPTGDDLRIGDPTVFEVTHKEGSAVDYINDFFAGIVARVNGYKNPPDLAKSRRDARVQSRIDGAHGGEGTAKSGRLPRSGLPVEPSVVQSRINRAFGTDVAAAPPSLPGEDDAPIIVRRPDDLIVPASRPDSPSDRAVAALIASQRQRDQQILNGFAPVRTGEAVAGGKGDRLSAPATARFGGDVPDPDALRQAMESGADAIGQGGRDAETAIAKGGAELPDQGRAAGQAIADGAREGASTFASMLQGIGAQIGREAAQAFKNNVGTLNVQANVGGLPRATGNKGQSMPNAGTPASGAEDRR